MARVMVQDEGEADTKTLIQIFTCIIKAQVGYIQTDGQKETLTGR